ncbi:Uroporphyrinogen-III synthase [Vanrija pseudolonga]|uniref:Uroporphyrinogen-III synthase n=1 Tax=Vanrija pseudolonga TaxID=143232 RepID=A0AAF1BHQ7_9TREE|nr:Uroporphyrinogen-III synthase [Vanrija pseudolonga]
MEDRDAPAPTRLVLFRTPANGDSYPTTLARYAPISVPALADRLLPSALEPVLAAGAGGWEAVVITSRRAAEAWVAAAASVTLPAEAEAEAEAWSSVQVYSPGPAVGSVLDASGLPPALRPSPGPTAISAASLAPLLLSVPPRDGAAGYRPYLLLTGDKTLPTLGDALAAAGRQAIKVQVYATAPAPSLADDVGRLEASLRWAALFSPSSASYVLPLLEAAGFGVRPDGAQDRRLRIAAIGETTAAWLRDAGYALDAVAATPNAEGLLAAIDAAEAGERRS